MHRFFFPFCSRELRLPYALVIQFGTSIIPTLQFVRFPVFLPGLKKEDFILIVTLPELFEGCSGVNKSTLADFTVQNHGDISGGLLEAVLSNVMHCYQAALSPSISPSTCSTLSPLPTRTYTSRNSLIP